MTKKITIGILCKFRVTLWFNFSLIEKEQERSVYSDAFEWTRYHTLDEIYAWLDEQLEKHPDILTDYDVGLSHENRTIRAIRLSHNSVSILELV